MESPDRTDRQRYGRGQSPDLAVADRDLILLHLPRQHLNRFVTGAVENCIPYCTPLDPLTGVDDP